MWFSVKVKLSFNKSPHYKPRRLRLSNNIYKIEVDGCTTLMGKEYKVVSWDEGELWHMRLGHLHHGALKVMQELSTRLPKGTLAQLDTCKGCTMRKYAKATSHVKENRALKILERVHSDMCGPFSTALKKITSTM